MENEILKINKENLLETINNGVMGSVIVEVDKEETFKLLKNAVEACNILRRYSVNVNQYHEEYEDEHGNLATQPVIETYKLFFTREYSPCNLTFDDITLKEKAELCSRENVSVEFNINPELIDFAKKIARQNKIKFVGTGFESGVRFSVTKKIEESYLSGDLKLELSLNETSIHTVRAYCALLKNKYNSNIYCRMNGNSITVWFREPTPKEQAVENFKKSIQELVFVGVITENERIKALSVLYKDEKIQTIGVPFDAKKAIEDKVVLTEYQKTNNESKEFHHILEDTVKPTEGTGKTLELQPLLLQPDNQFKIPETEEEEEEEAIAGNPEQFRYLGEADHIDENTNLDYDQAGNKFGIPVEDDDF